MARARPLTGKVLVLLCDPIRTPPFSKAARIEAGMLIRLLQDGIMIGLPHSRPMPSVGKRCHELRIVDETVTWRLFYRIDSDAIGVIERLAKKTNKTPRPTIEVCERRLRQYDDIRN